MDEKQAKSYARFPIGHDGFDGALGGGLVKGAIVELVGKPNSGKRTFARAVLARAMREGMLARWIEVRGATCDYDHSYTMACCRAEPNPDGSPPLVLALSEVEQEPRDALEYLYRTVATARCGVVVLSHAENVCEDRKAPLVVQVVNQQLRRVCGAATSTGTIVLVLMSERRRVEDACAELGLDAEKLSVKATAWSGEDEASALRNALKFYAGIRIELSAHNWLALGGKNLLGIRGKGRIIKNKFAPPFATFEFRVQHSRGLATSADCGAAGPPGP